MTEPIHRQLRTIRRALRIHQQQLADMLGVCPSSISNRERGVKDPTVRDTDAHAHALHHYLVVVTPEGVTVCELVDLVPNLATFRQAQGVSQRRLARAMHTTRHAVANLERRIAAGQATRLITAEQYLRGLGYGVGLVPAGALERAA